MARLPSVGGDTGDWGTVLNEFLSVQHHADGGVKHVPRIINVKDMAATTEQRAVLGNGQSHPLTTFYSELAAAQTAYPHVTALSDELDWAVLQKAIATAGGATISTSFAGAVGTQPAVYIPSGIFVINQELSMNGDPLWMHGSYANIFSDAKPVIQQINPTKDIFHWINAYDIFVQGITFVGGRHQITFTNNNGDGARFRIMYCDFRQSESYAVNTANSINTLLVMDHCRVQACKMILYNTCAPAVLRDTWVTGTSAIPPNTAFIKNDTWLILDDFWGSPDVGSANKNRWIDNYSTVYIERSRFGGEGPTGGISAVWNFAGPIGSNGFTSPTTVSITNSGLACGTDLTDSDTGVVNIRTGIPQTIILRANQHFSHAPKIVNGGALDVASYVAGFPDMRWKFEVEPNDKWQDHLTSVPAVPPEFLPFVVYLKLAERMVAPPTTGTYEKGQILYSATPDVHGFIGWICVSGGTPGVWKPFGNILNT